MDANGDCSERIPFATIRFGEVKCTDEVDAFRHVLNHELITLMESLPAVLHSDAVIFFLNDLKIPILPRFDFFRNYFAPAWSVLYWMEQQAGRQPLLTTADRRNARTAHAMALFLHLLDDHLNDGQLQASHLILLLRSQAWWRMKTALKQMVADVATGDRIVNDAFDAYYGSIGSPPALATLEGYCAHFRNQMATGMIVPRLMASKMGCGDDYTNALTTAYSSFGVAWRLLDDWQDLEEDIQRGCHSAVYFGSPPDVRRLWDSAPEGDRAKPRQKIKTLVQRYGIGETLRRKIGLELTSAASMMEGIHMTGLADELRCLAEPLSTAKTPA
jgi:hypothetical protein